MTKWFIFGISGAIGTFCRYFLSSIVQNSLGFQFPYGTLTVNCLGCLIAGFFFIFSEAKGLWDSNIRLYVQIGFCGAFTTFSSLILETFSLFKNHELLMACTNIGGNLIGGILAFIIGCLLAYLF
jgi:fluoride exporter